MRTLRLMAALGLILALAACNVTLTPTTPQPRVDAPDITIDPSGTFVEGQVIIGYAKGANPAEIAARLGASVRTNWRGLHAALLELPNGMETEKALALFKRMREVSYAELNKVIEQEPVPDAGVGTAGLETQQLDIEDPEYARQWQHRQLNSEAAWALGATGAGIRIGIHDDFIDHRHPDLVGNMVYPGYDGFSETLITPETPHNGVGTHGTSVAGKAAAVGNTVGGRGVAFEADIVPLAIDDPESGALVTSAIVNAGVFAADGPDGNSPLFGPGEDTDSAPGRNAYVDIVNMSWGSNGYDQIVSDTMNYMMLHGIVLVTSAGNTPTVGLASPAWYPGLITVAATNPRDQRTEFSNRGQHINVAAPGQQTWTPATRCRLLERPEVVASDYCELPEDDENQYRYFGGTSSASPAVAGVAALILDAAAERDAGGNITGIPLDPAQVRRILEQTAFRPDGDEFNEDLGYGIADAGAAVQAVLDGNIPEAGGSLTVFVAAESNPEVALPITGLSLVPNGAEGPTKYTQTTDGTFLGFIDDSNAFGEASFGQGVGYFQWMYPGDYRLLASGPHEASTGIEAGTAERAVSLTAGTTEEASILLDIELPNDPFEPNDTVDAAASISAGTSVRALFFSQTGDSDVDLYALPVGAGESYRVNLESIVGDFDTFLRILGSDGTVIAQNDDNQNADEGFLDSLVDFTAPATGTVYIEVTELSGANSPFNIYDMDVASPIVTETEPNGAVENVVSTTITLKGVNPFENAQALALGSAVNARIDASEDPGNPGAESTDTDIYAVDLSAGTTVVVDVETEVSGAPDTLLGLYYVRDDAGTQVVEQVAFNDDFTGRESRLSYTVPDGDAGTYYAVVVPWDAFSGTNGTFGDYGLTVTARVNPELVDP